LIGVTRCKNASRDVGKLQYADLDVHSRLLEPALLAEYDLRRRVNETFRLLGIGTYLTVTQELV
jgi:hypothetical protein